MPALAQASTHRRRRPSGEPPPLPRPLNRAGIGWLGALVFFSALWIWIFLSDEPAIWITKRDLEIMKPIVDHRVDWVDSVMEAANNVGTSWATPVVGWATLFGALLTRRVRHGVVLLGSLALTAAVVTLIAGQIQRPRPLGLEITGDWAGFAQPSRPVALLAGVLVAAAHTLIPRRWRKRWYIASAATLALFGSAQVYTAVEHPTDVFAGGTAGIAITIVMYRLLAPEAAFPITYRKGKAAHLDVGGERGAAIRTALLEQLSIEAVSVEPVNLQSSAGSTPLRIESSTGEIYFGKLYASTHLRSDRSYKLGRTLLYGQLEDETKYTSVRRLVQHEDYMLHVMHRCGIPCAEPLGIVEITPEREYLVVTDFLGGAVEISEAQVTEEIIDQALETVGIMWKAGLAHRDIKPGNVMVQAGKLRLVDVGFAQIRPSPWRQAVDLANMMLVLALQSSPEVVYDHARQHFSAEEIAEAFAASRGVTLPSQLRRKVHDDKRDLLTAFKSLVPDRPPVAIQRWTMRRVGVTLGYGLVAFAVVAILVSGLESIGLV